ncbi:MAG: hypothetical protein AAFP70_04870, partial [Calditrichota bacterium]
VKKNAIIWIGGIFASFILPMVAQSVAIGAGNFLQVIAQVGPLFIALFLSTSAIKNASDS